jgi:hypothetical protein
MAGTLRAECLDWTIILGRRHLEPLLRTYTSLITTRRGLIEGSAFERLPEHITSGHCPNGALNARRQDVLSGLIHEYRDA